MNDFRLYRLRMEAHGSADIAKKKQEILQPPASLLYEKPFTNLIFKSVL